VKTSTEEPIISQKDTLPPQIEKAGSNAPNDEKPAKKPRSRGSKVTLGVLILLILTLPVAAYFVSQPEAITSVLNYAKIPPEFAPPGKGEEMGLPEKGTKAEAEKANKENEAAFREDASKPAQAPAALAGGSPGTLIAQGTLSSGAAGTEFQAWAIAHGGSFVVTTGANGCPSGCTEFIGAYPTLEAAKAAIAAAGGGTFQIDNAKTGEYTSYQKEGIPKGSTGEKVVRDDTRKITTVVTASPTAVPTSVPTTVPTVVPTSVPTTVPTTIPPTPIPGNPYCDASCNVDADCPSGLLCATVSGVKRCRNAVCISYSNCTCPTTPTPTTVVTTGVPGPTIIAAAPIPKTPVSGAPSVLGVATIGGGILLLLLGLLL